MKSRIESNNNEMALEREHEKEYAESISEITETQSKVDADENTLPQHFKSRFLFINK